MTEGRLIYGLRDPRTDFILYVSQTRTGLTRPKVHWSPSSLAKRENPILANKLRAILAAGLRPGIDVLKHCDSDTHLNEAEVFWIGKCRAMGYPLTNILNGGTKPPRITLTPEHKEKLRLSHVGKPGPNAGRTRSEESKRKTSVTMTGRTGKAHTAILLLSIAAKRSRPFTDESGNLYSSPMEASLKLGLNNKSLSHTLHGGRSLHGHRFTFVTA